jgi:hypothetical protein
MKMESPNRLFWTNLSGSQTYYWILPDELISQLGVQWKPALAAAPSLIAEADRALIEIHRLKQRANRNQVTLDATAGAIRLMRGSARKIVVIDRVRQLMAQGKESECIRELESLRRYEAVVLADLIRVRDERCGTPWDVDNARKQIDATPRLTPQLQ